MTESAFSLVDARGRKYLTAAERKRFLAAVRTHPTPAVQTLALTGCRVSEALATRACDVDLEAREVRIATLKRRRAAWRAVPVPEDLLHAHELVHRLRRAQGSARGAKSLLWPITRQNANRQVGAIMRGAGIEGSQACPRGLPTPSASRSRPSSRCSGTRRFRRPALRGGRGRSQPARHQSRPRGAWRAARGDSLPGAMDPGDQRVTHHRRLHCDRGRAQKTVTNQEVRINRLRPRWPPAVWAPTPPAPCRCNHHRHGR